MPGIQFILYLFTLYEQFPRLLYDNLPNDYSPNHLNQLLISTCGRTACLSELCFPSTCGYKFEVVVQLLVLSFAYCIIDKGQLSLWIGLSWSITQLLAKLEATSLCLMHLLKMKIQQMCTTHLYSRCNDEELSWPTSMNFHARTDYKIEW